jgi:hypothetical protein
VPAAKKSPRTKNPESLRQALVALLENFAVELRTDDLRGKVRALVPAFQKLQSLGASLIPAEEAANVHERIIAYLRKYAKQVIDGRELMVVSGIGEWARRVRELRVQFGWWIYSGMTFKHIAADKENKADIDGIRDELGIEPSMIKPNQYVLMREDQDRDAAFRWNTLNGIRKGKGSVRDKILAYLRVNVGKAVTGEELKYLAKDKKEWARRVRELRTQFGWPVKTKSSGRLDLPIGAYVLEADRQAPEHDRKIPDWVRMEVLERDHFKCSDCGWNRDKLSPDDRRAMLELHHKEHHGKGGKNTVENLVTLCNVCHDKRHVQERKAGRA